MRGPIARRSRAPVTRRFPMPAMFRNMSSRRRWPTIFFASPGLHDSELMTMRVWYFSENAYPYLPDGLDNLRVTLPNRLFDPKIGAELYSRYFDEWQLADEEGLDLMCNEHHQTAINLN